MERKLLMIAHENYNELKKEFQLVLAENKRLRAEAKREIIAEIEHFRGITRQVLQDIELEKKIRDDVFEQFKAKTVSDISEMYEEELKHLLERATQHEQEFIKLNVGVATKDNAIEELKKELHRVTVRHQVEVEELKTEKAVEINRKLAEFNEKFPKYSELETKVKMLYQRIKEYEEEFKHKEEEKKEEIEKNTLINAERKRLEVENTFRTQEINRLEKTVLELTNSKFELENLVLKTKEDAVKIDKDRYQTIQRLEFELREMTLTLEKESHRNDTLEEKNQKYKNRLKKLNEENKSMVDELREHRRLNQTRIQKKQKRDLELQQLGLPQE